MEGRLLVMAEGRGKGGGYAKEINELDVLAAAYLYGQQQTQEAIGRNLGLSQTVVSRLLSDAKKQGYTRKVNTFVRKDLDDAAMARIQTSGFVRCTTCKRFWRGSARTGQSCQGRWFTCIPARAGTCR